MNTALKMKLEEMNRRLNEIEQLDGILIATTNLAENMDKAFERRFLMIQNSLYQYHFPWQKWKWR